MAAATGLGLLKSGFAFSSHEWQLLVVGMIASFGVYRIVAAIVLAFVLLQGSNKTTRLGRVS